ncbi:hypothetical protein [Lignipirellula cremea]|uniref:Uncharacterized protein n=1 Tax=Lignipirellula cremea TaxID=2528010 RepID=A0A518DY92_9BACT|nr:hypothetical protein [Lignipirellula cremea]QDU96816.1 hypothetical protein Pla8534_46380 [Lignipirellula cremea]
MPRYLRVIVCLSTFLAGGFLGFWAVLYLADALLPPSAGPTPYGDWRPGVYALLAGVPLGAACGLLGGILLSRSRQAPGSPETKWIYWTLTGLVIGVVAGFFGYGTVLYELFEGIGQFTGAASLATLAYFAFCGMLGGAALAMCALVLRRWR